MIAETLHFKSRLITGYIKKKISLIVYFYTLLQSQNSNHQDKIGQSWQATAL